MAMYLSALSTEYTLRHMHLTHVHVSFAAPSFASLHRPLSLSPYHISASQPRSTIELSCVVACRPPSRWIDAKSETFPKEYSIVPTWVGTNLIRC